MDLDRLNPVTLIAGAASGIGAVYAKDMARRSQGGLILADADEAGLAAVADDIERLNLAPERISTLAFNLADAERWTQASDFIQSQYGRLDWAVVNAGAAPAPTGEATDLVEWRRDGVAELESVVLALRAAMAVMGKSLQGGAIVVCASPATFGAEPEANAASKALLQLMRAAAAEGAPDAIRVNAIAPGNVSTPGWASTPWFSDLVRESGAERAALEKIATLSPALARYGAAEKTARLLVMLLSDESSISGATLVVDGGYTL